MRLEFAQYRLRTLIEYEMLGRVFTEEQIIELIADWYQFIVARSACCSDEKRKLAVPELMKTDAGLQLAIWKRAGYFLR